MASQVKDAAWLEWIAGLVRAESRQTQTTTLHPDRFHCLLDELPLHLIPQRSLGLQLPESVDESLFLNPQCSIFPPGRAPAELESHSFLLDGLTCKAQSRGCAMQAARCILFGSAPRCGMPFLGFSLGNEYQSPFRVGSAVFWRAPEYSRRHFRTRSESGSGRKSSGKAPENFRRKTMLLSVA